MRLLFRLLITSSLVGFALIKSHEKRSDRYAASLGRDRAASEPALDALQRAAAAKLFEAAQERCAKDPRDCLSLLNAISAGTARRAEAK